MNAKLNPSLRALASALVLVEALHKVSHDGKDRVPNTESAFFHLPPADAKALVDVGAVRIADVLDTEALSGPAVTFADVADMAAGDLALAGITSPPPLIKVDEVIKQMEVTQADLAALQATHDELVGNHSGVLEALHDSNVRVVEMEQQIEALKAEAAAQSFAGADDAAADTSKAKAGAKAAKQA